MITYSNRWLSLHLIQHLNKGIDIGKTFPWKYPGAHVLKAPQREFLDKVWAKPAPHGTQYWDGVAPLYLER